VLRYEGYLNTLGHETSRHRYPAGYECDLFDETALVLYEAKSNTLRASLRIAVGQLLDYRRFEPASDLGMVVLVPRSPSEDSLAFLKSVNVGAVWETAAGFTSP
jgi:hypothetical protein